MRKILLVVGLVIALQLVLAPVSLADSAASGGFWHKVQRGETLFSIGRLYGVNPYTICYQNGLGNCNHIRAGQSLWIPTKVPPTPGCAAYHTVAKGQTLSSIGRMYGVSAWKIASANRIHDLNRIYAGQILCIPGASAY